MRHPILYSFIFLTFASFSQNLDKKAKCVEDFMLSNDTLTVFSRRSTCDTIFYYKFQVFKNEIGTITREFDVLKIKQSKRCFDIYRPDPRSLHFKVFCTSNIDSQVDYKGLSEFEVKILNPVATKFDCNEKVSFYLYSKNKSVVNKKQVHCLSMLHDLLNILGCLTRDPDVRSG